MNTRGVEQSQALTRAAQKLSAARSDLEVLNDWKSSAPYHRALDRLESAELAYKAAYKAYTNPFGVVKTA